MAEKMNEGGTTEAWPFVLLWMKGLFIFSLGAVFRNNKAENAKK
jgi:hypothetical protein